MSKFSADKPYVIAEVGSIFKTQEDALKSIRGAHECGASAVKFQLFGPTDLYGPRFAGVLNTPDFPDGPTYLPLAWFPRLKEEADRCGIEFMCSAFSPELVDAVDPFVVAHKIASSDNSYPQLLQRVKSKGKPILLSTGATTDLDLYKAISLLLHSNGTPDLVLLYCVSAYPSRNFNLFQMQELKERFRLPVGLSDHSLDVLYPALSAVHHFGACVIEKHVTFLDYHTPDTNHSLNASQFKRMCDYLHGISDYRLLAPQLEEEAMFSMHNRRLVATQEVAVGEILRFNGNFGAYRSLGGPKTDSLSPFLWDEVDNRLAKNALMPGQSIVVGDF